MIPTSLLRFLTLAFTIFITTTTAVTTDVDLSPAQLQARQQPTNATLHARDEWKHWECKNYQEIEDMSGRRRSPRWGDCLKMMDDVKDGQNYKKKFPNWIAPPLYEEYDITVFNSCRLRVFVIHHRESTKIQHPLGTWAKIGNNDVRKIIEQVEDFFLGMDNSDKVNYEKDKDGNVVKKTINEDATISAKGVMDCYRWDLSKDTFWVRWDLMLHCDFDHVWDSPHDFRGYTCYKEDSTPDTN